jgi:large subunit ribosomal protein L10
MPTEAKRQAVTDLAEMLRDSSALAVADYRGLTVSEMHTVRRSLRANGVSLKVAKNRLLKIAADEAGLAELKPMLDGPTAIAATSGDEVSLARALQDAFRPFKVVTVRGGLLGGQPINAADLQRLASLPSREVLLGRLAGGMAAPLTGMASVLAANLRNLVGVLNAVADQKRLTEGAAATIPAEASAVASTEEPSSAETEDSAEATDAAEAPEPAEATDAAETAASADSAEDTELAETTEAAEETGTADSAENVDAPETAEVPDGADADPPEPADSAEDTETTTD